jgi:two-component system aerobic respiration control sensor histidine kinase ArcB
MNAKTTKRDITLFTQSLRFLLHSNTPLNVLLVEDNPLVQKANTICLKALGCEVMVARSGEEALCLFDNSFDLVLLDLSLGEGIDGYSVSRILRARFPYSSTPIMACTAHGPEVIQDCLDSGMSGYLEKPFFMEQLHPALLKAI